MNRIISLVVLAGILGGCATREVPVIVHRNVVVKPPEGLYDCPETVVIPPGNTQRDAATAIANLADGYLRCRTTVRSTRDYLDRAAKITEQNPTGSPK